MTGSSVIAACLLVVVAITAIDASKTFREEAFRTNTKDHGASMRNRDMFEGDMKLTTEQDEQIQAQINGEPVDLPEGVAGKALRSLSTRWPDATVPYVIDSSIEAQTEILNIAMRHWEIRTCLRFVQRTNQQNFIRFILSSGCWSYVGMIGGQQDISIGNGCQYLDIVAHEIGHAIGFFHEQSRPDRDEYIVVHLQNVPESYRNNFNKYTTNDINTHDVPYDIASVMHYSPYAFSNNGQPTITVRDGNPQDPDILGAAEGLSCTDIELANLAYSCSDQDGWEDYECDPEREGYNYEYVEQNGSHRAGMHVSNDDEDGETTFIRDDDQPVDVIAGEPFTVFCYSEQRVPESEYDEVILEFTLDGEVIDADERLVYESEVSYFYDSSTGENDGRPYLTLELIGRTEDHGKILACTVDTTGDRDISVPEVSMILHVGCRAAMHVPCGDECLDDFDLICNGDEDCPGGTDELDCDDRCDRVFDDENGGMFTSHPGFNDGENYPNNHDCASLIRAPEGKVVVLQFEEFNVEEESDCAWDVVEIYDGDSNQDNRPIARFCGNDLPPQIKSRRRHLLIVFKTDGSVNDAGFLANYAFDDARVGGGNMTGIIDAYAGAFNGFVDLRVPDDASDWRVVLTFDRKLRSLKITSNCNAEVVEKKRKSTRFVIKNKMGRGALRAGEFLYFEFTAITSPSRRVKGATAEVVFERR